MVTQLFFTLLFALLCAPALLVPIDFIIFILTGKRLFHPYFAKILDIWTIIALPIAYAMLLDLPESNNCCTDSATFSPQHRITIYSWIIICVGSFLYATNRRQMASPIVEVVVNSLLILGVILNGLLAYHIDFPLSLIGNLPIALLFMFALMQNQQLFIQSLQNQLPPPSSSIINKWAWQVLTAPILLKYPLFLLLCLPILTIVTTILILFGQQPDAAIRAFTDTYKHGFSQLDHLCKNVDCGDHYLCSVAANGHPKVVQPQRLGIRNGAYIICNRQLLVANAFEELLADYFPKGHRIIRRNYNKVGNVVHRHYHIFNNKSVSDVVYVLMKPLEWLFLITLYTFDRQPENRIAKQYLGN